MTNSIVIVDKDPDRLYLYKKAWELCRLPGAVETAASQEALLTLLDQLFLPPSLILLDLEPLLEDGLSTLEQIRTHSRFRRIPVILLSKAGDAETIEVAYAAGANSVIIKPVSELETIKRFVEGVSTYWLIYNRTAKLYDRA